MSPRRTVPPLVGSVKRAIADADRRRPGAGESWEAELALRLAAEVEGLGEDVTLAARVSASRELREVMSVIQATAPAEKATDRVDDLERRRAVRKAKSA